jgi:hypothetical protein
VSNARIHAPRWNFDANIQGCADTNSACNIGAHVSCAKKDGDDTRVMRIHLDCLQHGENPVPQPPTQVQDVLDAGGNVVGPALLVYVRNLAATRDSILSPPQCPGVERIDVSHPAWPEKKTQPDLSGQSGIVPNTKSKGEEMVQDSSQVPAAASGPPSMPPCIILEKSLPADAIDAPTEPAVVQVLHQTKVLPETKAEPVK